MATKAFPPNALQTAGHLTNAWELELPADRSLDDCLDETAYANLGTMMRPHDTIRVIQQASLDYALLLVTAAGRGFAKTKMLQHVKVDVAANDEAPPSGFTVKWVSPRLKWGVIRDADNERLKENFEDKVAAQRWVDDHLKSLAR